jgi:hypothetical protein
MFRPSRPIQEAVVRPLFCPVSHSQTEERLYCFGEVDGGVLSVRFTYRASIIRIIGAGYWRKGKAIYERENQIHR